MSNRTVAAGMIHFALRRSQNIHWQSVDITREAHAAQKNQQQKLLWFTGFSGSGKSTIDNLVENKLHALGKHSLLTTGDNVRCPKHVASGIHLSVSVEHGCRQKI